MNELKLSLHNFQSISEGELIFNTGLNFIIGQSNSGKSATFRALKACLLNPKGSQRFIKKGTKGASVTLIYNGNEITWDRSSKESSYLINGQEYIKTGTSDSFKILINDTGFVKDEKEGALMNIEEELQLPFPFGISKADLFKLFENVFCVSDSAVILKAAKEQEDNIKDNIDALELDEAKVQNKLRNIQEFKDEIDLEKLRNYKALLEGGSKRIEILKEGLPLIKKVIQIDKAKLEVGEEDFIDWFSPYLEALELKKVLIRIKDLHNLNKDLQELDIELVDLKEKYWDLVKFQNVVRTLTRVENILAPEQDFKNCLQHYEVLKSLNNTLQKLIELNKIKVREENFTSIH